MSDLLVGIDIGTRYTKIVSLEGKDKFSLSEAFIFPTPYVASYEEIKPVEGKTLLKNITDVIPLKKLHTAKIGINLPTSVITALSAYLPLMNKNELAFAAINEAKQKMIPASGPGHIFECLFLGERAINNTLKAEVLVIRTENIHVQRLLQLFKEFELIPSLITPNCCVVSNSISKESWQKDEELVFVDIGASFISISIARDEKLVFMRNITYGMTDIVSDISRQLAITEDQAKKVIADKGVPEVVFDLKNKVALAEEIMRQKYEDMQNTAGEKELSVNTLELRMLWQPHIERILQELRRSFVFYKDQVQGKRIEKINFLGGVSHVHNLFNILSSQIGGQCQLLGISSGVPIHKEKHSNDSEIINNPVFVNASSLCLGLSKIKLKEGAGLNFLPLELKRRDVIAKIRLVSITAIVLLFSVFSVISCKVFIDNFMLRSNIKKVEFEMNRSKRIADRLKELDGAEKKARDKINKIDELSSKNPNPASVLLALNKIVPKEIVFKNFIFSNGQIEVKAEVFADYEQASAILEDFRRNMEKEGHFKNINISAIKLEKFTPQIIGLNGEIRLTRPEKREFDFIAEANL